MTESKNLFEEFWKKWDAFVFTKKDGSEKSSQTPVFFQKDYLNFKKEFFELCEKQAKKEIVKSRSHYTPFWDTQHLDCEFKCSNITKADTFRLVAPKILKPTNLVKSSSSPKIKK